MSLCGNKCLKTVSITEALKCNGCGVMFHFECLKIQKQLCIDIMKWPIPNVIFKCDKCVKSDDDEKFVKETLQKILSKMTEKEERENKIIERIENIEKSLTIHGDEIADKVVKAVEESHPVGANEWKKVQNKKKNKRNDSVIVITPKDKEQQRDVTRKSLKTTMDPNEITVKAWSNAANNGVLLRCENDDECDKLMAEATKKLGNQYDVKKPTKRQPRFKILRVEDPEESDDDFIKDLKKRNPTIDDENCKFEIVKREQVKIKGKNVEGCFNMVMQTNGATFNKIMEEGKLKMKWKLCKVVDNIYIRRCYKCYGFSHDSKTCTAPDIACSKCSLPHLNKDCKATEEKCINCVNTNKRIKGVNLQENHHVWSQECQVYKRRLEMSKRAIDYIN